MIKRLSAYSYVLTQLWKYILIYINTYSCSLYMYTCTTVHVKYNLSITVHLYLSMYYLSILLLSSVLLSTCYCYNEFYSINNYFGLLKKTCYSITYNWILCDVIQFYEQIFLIFIVNQIHLIYFMSHYCAIQLIIFMQ